MKTHTHYQQLLALALGAVCAAGFSVNVSAEEASQEKPAAKSLIIGGIQHSNQSEFSYLGYIKPIWGGELGKGWFMTVMGSRLAYQYDINFNNQPDTLEARAPGIDAGLGYGWSTKDYYLSLSAALGYRHFNLSPNVPGEKPEGSVFNFTPQIQAGYNLTEHFDIGLLSNYSFGQQSNFNRLRLGYKPAWNWHFGLESFYQEGRNFRIKQNGVFATTLFTNGFGLELSAGNLENQDGASTGYYGLAFSKLF